jgi:threonine/homoserine/homoserine lactone efflux protein
MIELHNLLLFTAAGIALNLTPGPDMIYCATRSLGQGRLAGVVSALGIGAGSIIHMIFAALGLSALLMYSATAFTMIYLVYLGVRMIRSKPQASPGAKRLPEASLRKIFTQGVVTNVLNPKVALFYMSFMPQFIDPSRGSVALQVIILGMIFNFTGTTVNASVGYFFGYFGAWMERRPMFWKVQRWVSGSVLIGLGLSLALPDRR